MSILIFALIVLLFAVAAILIVNTIAKSVDGDVIKIVDVVIILIAIVVIAQRAGLI